MHKLAGLDAAFLYAETARCPQHIASVQVVEPPPGADMSTWVARFRETVGARLHRVPYFTNRLQHTPLGLDHPVWVRDDAFDLQHHVREYPVPAPGGRVQFEAAIATLHALPLDRNRPLWEIWVLTGLEGGRIAYYNRVHHACLDGVSGQNAVRAVFDEAPEGDVIEAPPADQAARPSAEAPARLLLAALDNLAGYQVRQARSLFRYLDTGVRLLQRAVDPGKGLGAASEPAPHTAFNRSVLKPRSYATGELPLAEAKAIGKVTGATLNDVFLAVCGGALRRYLDRKGQLPARSLIAGCPVSLRRPGDKSLNNQVTMMQVTFATDEADPVKRLLRIAKSSTQAKGVVADLATSYDTNIALPGLPGLMGTAARFVEAANLAELPQPALPFNMVVSNVPGPRKALYSLGGRVLTHYPVSIPAHGQAVNVTVQSYVDQLFFGVTGCARALPDAGLLRDDMLAAFAELTEAVLGSRVAGTAGHGVPVPFTRRAQPAERAAITGAGVATEGERPRQSEAA